MTNPNKDMLTWLKTQAIVRARRAVIGSSERHMAVAERFQAAADEIEGLRHEVLQARSMLETAERSVRPSREGGAS